MTIEDSGRHPAEVHPDAAAQEIRAFNHATLMRDSIREPATVYRSLGEMYTLAGFLDQAYAQLSNALLTQLETGALGVDPGTEFGDDVAFAVGAAREHLQYARGAIKVVYDELTHAQAAIAAVHVR